MKGSQILWYLSPSSVLLGQRKYERYYLQVSLWYDWTTLTMYMEETALPAFVVYDYINKVHGRNGSANFYLHNNKKM